MSIQQNATRTLNEDYRRRESYTVSFKLDVCRYFRDFPNATVSGCARNFGLTNKQVRYFRRNEEAYRNMSTRRQRRNIIRPERVKLRAKYPDQERNVFQHFVDQRQQGKFI